ncbi:MAG: hypothetical protein ACFE0Q_01640 [Anaerolineae bacterium]
MSWTQPKTWVNEPLIASDLNTHLRDNLEALKNPPQGGTNIDNSTDYATSATSFVDVDSTDFSTTLTTNGGDVLVTLAANVRANSASLIMFFDITLDGVRCGGDDGILRKEVRNFSDEICLLYWIKDVPAGEHTVRLQWHMNSGSGTLLGGQGSATEQLHGQWDVREVS